MEVDNFRILIDAGPDLRQQALREGITSLVLITHAHYDHIAGIGDLKLFMKDDVPTTLFGDEETVRVVENYPFFSKSKLYPAILSGHAFYGNFSIIGCNLPIIPFNSKYDVTQPRVNKFNHKSLWK